MKIKLIDASPFIEGVYVPSLNFKTTGSYAVIRDNKIVQLKIKDFHLESPSLSDPYCEFELEKLDKEIEIKDHKYSNYRMKFKIPETLSPWYFADLNRFEYMQLRFNRNETWLNKSNIHSFIYGFFGGVIGSMVIYWLTK